VKILVKETMIDVIRTLRSAPALELNLVAVTTRLFLGSTAPTTTSGVSTTATNLGGAVRMAARPYLTANVGVPGRGERDEGLGGIPVGGVREVDMLNRPWPWLTPDGDIFNEGRRCRDDTDEVERARVETVRKRGKETGVSGALGSKKLVDGGEAGFSSPSVH
jgi:hypothetical protein